MNSFQRPLVQAASWDLAGAACTHLTGWWADLERELARATTVRQRGRSVARAATYCRICPVHAGCGERARLDDYTGIAAGAEYRNGHRHDHPTRAPS